MKMNITLNKYIKLRIWLKINITNKEYNKNYLVKMYIIKIYIHKINITKINITKNPLVLLCIVYKLHKDYHFVFLSQGKNKFHFHS